jgi:hypothetical protein
MVGIKLPDDRSLPDGPLRVLVTELHRLYSLADRPPTRTVARWTTQDPRIAPVSHSLVSDVLNGRKASLWGKVESIAIALATHRKDGAQPADLDLELLHAAWEDAASPDRPRRFPTLGRAAPERGANTAVHFVHAGHAAGYSASGGDDRFLHGCVAVSAVAPDPQIARQVFDRTVQATVEQLQEEKILRRDSYSFRGRQHWTGYSWVIHGTVGKDTDGESYIWVELSAFGAVTVYFRDDVTYATPDEVLAYWVRGAAEMAYYVMRVIGLVGDAHAAALISVGRRDHAARATDDTYHEWHSDTTDLVPARFEAGAGARGAAIARAAWLRDTMRASRPAHEGELPSWDPERLRRRVSLGYRDSYGGPISPSR